MTTTASTFAQYAAERGIPQDRFDLARMTWEQERLAEATYPAVIPACPFWCVKDAGHEYDSYGHAEGGGIDHTRYHAGPDFPAGVRIDALEHNTGGVVHVEDAVVSLYERYEEMTAVEAKQLGHDLVEAAGFLRGLTEAATADTHL